ncbi:hypothetical protein B296_00024253 [Ensete ventricosum]|uniref:Uncharacterized protein n=1 Tax=Ensete ventricosum TaxID=4639 RepID=A0A426XJ84_ENSVE|nr:hypothetical protein B296_00024253 [Ensete ventricosum]
MKTTATRVTTWQLLITSGISVKVNKPTLLELLSSLVGRWAAEVRDKVAGSMMGPKIGTRAGAKVAEDPSGTRRRRHKAMKVLRWEMVELGNEGDPGGIDSNSQK